MSTVQALLNHMQFMYDSIDSGNFVISVFLDFKGAFDTVDHFIVKIKFLGIRGVSHEWLKGTVPEAIKFSSVFLLCLKILMVSGTMSENFRSIR